MFLRGENLETYDKYVLWQLKQLSKTELRSHLSKWYTQEYDKWVTIFTKKVKQGDRVAMLTIARLRNQCVMAPTKKTYLESAIYAVSQSHNIAKGRGAYLIDGYGMKWNSPKFKAAYKLYREAQRRMWDWYSVKI